MKAATAAVVVGLALGAVGCSSGDDDAAPPPPEVDGGWARVDVWEHLDVLAYDRVAVGNDPETLSWVTRRLQGDTDALAYSELRGNREPTAVELAEPASATPAPPAAPPPGSPPGSPPPTTRPAPEPVVIPVATATAENRWAALAVTRDSPRGDNTGVVAWHGARIPDGTAGNQAPTPATVLPMPDGVEGAPESAGVAATDDATVTVAVVQGAPVVWRSAAPASSDAAASWAAVEDPGLDVDRLVSVRIAADRDRFVLAAVDDAGQPHLWTSGDGEDWEPHDQEALPESAGGVALLTQVDASRVVVAWLADEETAPRHAGEVVVQSLDGDDLADEGTVTAADTSDVSSLDLNGAVLSPDDRLLVVGAAIRRSGEASPMVWAHDDGDWVASRQTELAGRIDYEMRAAVATDDSVVALVTNRTHIDVESWRWQTAEAQG